MKQTKTDSKNTTLTQKLKTHKKPIWVSLAIIVVYAISLFTPFVSNFTQYPLYVIKCAGLPLVANGGKSYDVPGTDTYGVTGLDEAFFCTEQEAQNAGYRRAYE